MKIALSFCCACLLFGAAPARGSMALHLSFEELCHQADRVAVVRVESARSFWGPDHHRIYTTFALRVEEPVAGTGPDRVLLTQPGGRVDGLAQRVHGYPRLRPGERTLLFLRALPDSVRVVGLTQGVFDPATLEGRPVWIQRLSGLSFAAHSAGPLLLDARLAPSEIRQLFSEAPR